MHAHTLASATAPTQGGHHGSAYKVGPTDERLKGAVDATCPMIAGDVGEEPLHFLRTTCTV